MGSACALWPYIGTTEYNEMTKLSVTAMSSEEGVSDATSLELVSKFSLLMLYGVSGYSDSSALGTALDSTKHFHPELTLVVQSFPRRRRSKQWILADNGTVPSCCLRSADL